MKYELNQDEIRLILGALRLDIRSCPVCTQIYDEECAECRAMQALIDRLDPKEA